MQNQWKIGCSFLEDWTPRAPTFTCARLLAIQDSFDRTTRNDCNALWWLDASIIPRGKHTTSRVYREHAGPTMLERKKKKNKPIRREKERGRKKEDSSLLFTGMKWKTWWTRDFEVLYEDGRKLISREWIVLSFWNRSVRLLRSFSLLLLGCCIWGIICISFLSFYVRSSISMTMFNCTQKDLFYKPILYYSPLIFQHRMIFLSSTNNLSFIVSNYPLCENKYGTHNELTHRLKH